MTVTVTTPPLPVATFLNLSANGVALYSARGLEQTLEPIDGAAVTRRTVNGTLVDLSVDKFRKYKSTISCEDVEAPALDGIMPGQLITVDCVAELTYPTAGEPTRTVITGSEREVGAYTVYRPRLDMMVTALNQSINEYERKVSWELELEEV